MRPPSARVSRWVQVTGIVGTVFLGGSAFWLSYRALTHLAELSGIADAWLWPLIVDGVIVVATVAAVAMAGRRGEWYPWLLLVCGAVVSVTANAIQAAMAPNLGVPHAMAATAASIPPIVLLAVTHLTVVLTRPTEIKPPKKRRTATPLVEAASPSPLLPPDANGHEIRTVDVDPTRAPLIVWAFEAYATGQWSLSDLCDELALRGLTSLPTPKRSAKTHQNQHPGQDVVEPLLPGRDRLQRSPTPRHPRPAGQRPDLAQSPRHAPGPQ